MSEQIPKFGVAGFPPKFWASEYRKDRLNGPEWVNKQGLNLIELQMTYGPRMHEDTARKFAEKASEWNVTLTIHASYFIVFVTSDEEKAKRSYETLEKTCKLALLCGANRIVLHPGSASDCRQSALDRFVKRMDYFCRNFLPDSVTIYPESAGKRNQLGSLEEILEICKRVPRCSPCLDFGHIRAFEGGGLTASEDFVRIFKKTDSVLGENASKKLHIHVTPIEYGTGGERRHRAYGELMSVGDQQDLFVDGKPSPYYPKPEHLAEAMFSCGLPAWVVSECYNSQEAGALAAANRYKQLSDSLVTAVV